VCHGEVLFVSAKSLEPCTPLAPHHDTWLPSHEGIVALKKHPRLSTSGNAGASYEERKLAPPCGSPALCTGSLCCLLLGWLPLSRLPFFLCGHKVWGKEKIRK